uniref:Adenosine deaminase domain-containing protein n=1 Tax=Arcella intermedia TaxID=1963864 RepID=A0A6B2L9R7_9EUKA|eukprot:TRINITY_DN3158_c0_g1_i1.p1 TRINITY_DN3158_c0_g1~~TRINITY_DN3158_c0_g1_i1.p1  ORF type:complete len:342 (-),score=75.27 TRINITY_DN3158_c0_g1_i1:9-989(-)
MPKVELHAHLGGSVENDTLRRLLKRKGLPNCNQLADKCIIKGIDNVRTPSEQFEMFEIIGSVWDSEEETKLFTREFIQTCSKNNIIYAELRTSGSSREKLLSILDTIDGCAKEYPTIIVRLVVSIKREWSLEVATRALELAVELIPRGVVGIDFCGNVTCGTFTAFQPLFLQAAQHGLKATIHFAESKDEMDLKEILAVGPARVGHACYLPEELTQHLKANNIPVEACFASNINTMKLWNGLKDHPVSRWREMGLHFVPCTDNYGILLSSLSDHYHMLHQQLGATPEELWGIARNAVEYIFESEQVKQKLRNIFDNHPLNPINKGN